MFLSVVLPFSSRFWLLAFCFGCFCAEEKTSADILDPSAYGFGNAPVSSGKLCAGIAKIWLFGPHSACSLIQPKIFASFISASSRSVGCFGIRTEGIQLRAVKNFQVSKALVVAAEKIPLNVPNHRFET